MKKLMLAAATVAVAGGAFSAPLVYDYKASVKHMYAKNISARDIAGTSRTVYQKVIKSASLRGYLVVDADGATSATLIGDRGDANTVPPTITLDHARNRAFLVVRNNSATLPKNIPAATFRTAKVLPANLEISFCESSMAYNRTTGFPNGKTGLASGYLYVGGETVAPVRPKLDFLAAGVTQRGVLATPAAAAAGISMIQDYLWTSCYLFGEYNSPDYEARNGVVWYAAVQTAIDAGFEPGVSLAALTAADPQPWAGLYYFHDTWMNGAGFGKFVRNTEDGVCCGFAADSDNRVLDTLSGNLKGGLFLCTWEGLYHLGVNSQAFNWQVGLTTADWEDQLFTPALEDGTGTYAADFDQRDLWQDGPLELNTTDAISGTWSIKRVPTRRAPSSAVTLAEIRTLTGNAAAVGTEASSGLEDLVNTLKGCALRLNDNTKFVATTGDSEIYNRVNRTSTHYDLPAITPFFAQYYGLANFN